MAKKRRTTRSKRKPKAVVAYATFRPVWRRVLLIDQMVRTGEACNCTQLGEALEVSRRTVLLHPERGLIPPHIGPTRTCAGAAAAFPGASLALPAGRA